MNNNQVFVWTYVFTSSREIPTSGTAVSYGKSAYDPVVQMVKKSACNAEGPGSIPGLGRSPGEVNSYPLQYSWAPKSLQMVAAAIKLKDTGSWEEKQ